MLNDLVSDAGEDSGAGSRKDVSYLTFLLPGGAPKHRLKRLQTKGSKARISSSEEALVREHCDDNEEPEAALL
jgi:hypothetical protein